MSIENIINHTKCPFATRAKLENIIIPSLDLNSEIPLVRDQISDFFCLKAKADYDALVFIFTDPLFGDTLDHLSTNTRNFFMALSETFCDLDVPTDIKNYDEICWPAIEGERFFMVSFANCYPESSPRFNHGDSRTYFFLQPVSSFERHAHDGEAITDEIRIKIRKLFEKNNQPYDGKLSNLKNEWVEMVAPLTVTDNIVKWWKT